MSIRYSRHARQRMAERGITEAEVEHVIGNPETSYTDREGNPVLLGTYRGRRIKVVLRKDSDPPYVITAAPRDGSRRPIMVRAVEYDEEAGALYIRLSDKPYAYGRDLDNERRVDFAADGTPIGVEFTCVTSGVDVRDVPAAREIGRIAEELHLPVFA